MSRPDPLAGALAAGFSVTRIEARRFVVEGQHSIRGGRYAPETYRRVWTSRRAAEADAARQSSIEADGLAYFDERQAARLDCARQYLAARAERQAEADRQGRLF